MNFIVADSSSSTSKTRHVTIGKSVDDIHSMDMYQPFKWQNMRQKNFLKENLKNDIPFKTFSVEE